MLSGHSPLWPSVLLTEIIHICTSESLWRADQFTGQLCHLCNQCCI